MGVEDVYRALWRHKLLIVGLTALLVAFAWFLTSRQTRIYESSTLLRVQQTVSDPSETYGVLVGSGRLAETYSNIVTTSSITDRIAEQLGGQVPRSQIRLHASPVADLDLLWVKADSANPRFAQAVAAAAPEALAAYIRETGTLHDRILTVQNPGLPTHPSKPNVELNVALAVLLGLILNSALALLIAVLGDRVTDLEELERITGLAVLTTIPNLSFSRPRSTMEVLGRKEGEEFPQNVPTLHPGPARGTSNG